MQTTKTQKQFNVYTTTTTSNTITNTTIIIVADLEFYSWRCQAKEASLSPSSSSFSSPSLS